MRRAGTVVVSLLVVATGCGGGDSSESVETFTVALLRAVPAENPGPFFDELRAAGFVEGRNLEVVPDTLQETHPLPEDAREAVTRWVGDGADLVVAYSSTGARAAREVAPDTNVLFLVNDPTAVGLVEQEDRPEGRLTGATFRVPADRTLALTRQALPDLRRLGFLYPADDPAGAPHRKAVEAAAADLGIEVHAEAFDSDEGIGPAVEAIAAGEADAVFVANTPTSVRALDLIEPAIADHALPLVANVDLAETALVVLSPDVDELQAQMGRQAVRLLNGADSSAVPVEDPRRFRVIVNLAQASALGLDSLPDQLLRQADEVKR